MPKTLLTLFLASAIVGVAQRPAKQKRPDVKAPAAKAKASAAPTADQIIDRYVEASGGREALGKLSSRVMKGNAELVGAPGKGEVEIYTKAPDKLMADLTLPALGHLQYGYDGRNGWRRDPSAGLVDVRGLDLAYMAFDSEFHKELKVKERYTRLELKGVEKVNGRDAYLIVATPSDLKPERLYFATDSGLLVHLGTDRETPEGKVTEEIDFEDYRMVDGVNVPFVESHTASGLTFVFRFTSVKNNVPVDDALFGKPAGD
jgi:hypothetical protein